MVIKVTLEDMAKLSLGEAYKSACHIYLGEKCIYCLRVYTTIAELEDAFYVGIQEDGFLAHESCFDEHYMK